MSTPGTDDEASPAPRTPRTPRGRRLRRLQGGLLGVALLAAAAVVVDQAQVTAPAARPYPSTWSRAAEPYAAMVARERGVDFAHPVYVDLLTPESFAAQVAGDRAELRHLAGSGVADAARVAEVAPLLLATGLVRGDDVPSGGLESALETAAQEEPLQTLGYYSYRDQRIRIRGTQLTAATADVLVRELTHALQDQTLDSGTGLEASARAQGPAAGAALATRHAVLAGDALRVEQAYRAGLDQSRQEALARADDRRAQQGAGSTLPAPVLSLLDARPRLGTALVRLAERSDGADAVDRLLTSPPRTDAELYDPLPTGPGTDPAPAADTSPPPPPPPAAAGEVEVTATGQADALLWYVVLAQHLMLPQAMAAADGLAGGGWSAYDIDGRACVTMRTTAAAGDLDRLATAVGDWTRHRPGAPVVVERQSDGLTFSTCVPVGLEPPVRGDGADRVGQAVALVVARTGLVRDGRVPAARPGAVRCYADTAVASISSDALVARPRREAVEARLDRLAARCLG